MPDRTQQLAEVFARLRWCVGGEFSVTVSPSQAELLLDALASPSAGESVAPEDEWAAIADAHRERGEGDAAWRAAAVADELRFYRLHVETLTRAVS